MSHLFLPSGRVPAINPDYGISIVSNTSIDNVLTTILLMRVLRRIEPWVPVNFQFISAKSISP